jgi:hypothetical protein
MEHYVAIDSNNIEGEIPESLILFLDTVIRGNDISQNKRMKVTSMVHAIMSAARPRSFLSQLQVSVGVWLHRKIGSRYLIDILNKLRLYAYYEEVSKFETSAMLKSTPPV